MRTIGLVCVLLLAFGAAPAQHVGILRKNYFSSYYDTTLMMNIEVLDSSTIRLGSINPASGVVSPVGGFEYASGINLNGATLDPYSNRYYIGKGFNFLTFDITTGAIVNDVPITGDLPSSAFQNFRFNPSDSTLYGMVPQNYYSTYFDSILMEPIEVLDSTQIRFASLNPQTGQYTLLGNASYGNIYTLAGNSIDPHQMVYYYSAVDTLVGIDVFTGAPFSAVPIQVPPNAIFENIAYSCADTSIYGITRQNYISMIFDSAFMEPIPVIDSTTFRLSKIDPVTGAVTFLSPSNMGAGGNLTGGAFIDPNTMTYYFSSGNLLVGASMVTGLITSSVPKTYPANGVAFDMMRSTQNCYGATKTRQNNQTGLKSTVQSGLEPVVFPNPAQDHITVRTVQPISRIEVMDCLGNPVHTNRTQTLDVSGLANGIYFLKVVCHNGAVEVGRFVKN